MKPKTENQLEIAELTAYLCYTHKFEIVDSEFDAKGGIKTYLTYKKKYITVMMNNRGSLKLMVKNNIYAKKYSLINSFKTTKDLDVIVKKIGAL